MGKKKKGKQSEGEKRKERETKKQGTIFFIFDIVKRLSFTKDMHDLNSMQVNIGSSNISSVNLVSKNH